MLIAAGRRRRTAVLWSLATALALLAPAPGWAAESVVGWYGTVEFVAPELAAALPPGSELEVGASAYVGISVETSTPDVNPDPEWGDYPGAVVSWTLQVAGLVFTNDPNGPLNRVEVLLDPAMVLYWPTSSVVAIPSLPGLSSLESDVFFRSVRPDALPSDALPPLPPEPADWEEAVTGVIDATTGEVLLDIDLTDVCVGACQPLIAAVPVPEWATRGLGVLLLLSGAAYLYARRGALRLGWVQPDGNPRRQA
ncbi:MAG: hypothetical protein VX681_02375 [Myxococcota bacterium]|nr:hypothetical protein [Myxococcota bacterium]